MVDTSFISFLYITLFLNCFLATVFIAIVPVPDVKHRRVSIHYYRIYFIAVAIEVLLFALREHHYEVAFTFFINFFALLAAYGVLFGEFWRHGVHVHLYRHVASIHLLIFASVQGALHYFLPELGWVRFLLTFINLLAVMSYALYILNRFEQKAQFRERIVLICLLVAAICCAIGGITLYLNSTTAPILSTFLIMQNLLTMLIFGVVFSILLYDAIDQYARYANTDTMTMLANRRYFFEQARKFLSAAQRYQYPVSIVICDIDFFKRINDSFGHAAGDSTIVHIAALLKAQCRDIDLAARIGGEEFVVLLPQTNEDEAFVFAERCRLVLRKKKIELGAEKVRVTASFGVACIENGDNIEDALNAADKALYVAKNFGRDKVVKYSEIIDDMENNQSVVQDIGNPSSL